MRVSSLSIFNGSIQNILQQQAQLFESQVEMASGKRVNSPSDDPLSFPNIQSKTVNIDTTSQYNKNSDSAMSRLEIEEAAIRSGIDLVQRVRDLSLQGASSTVSKQDRIAIANEIRLRLDELMGIGNTRGAAGDYMFSGFKTTTVPFTKSSTNVFTYNGDQGQNYLQVSSGVTLPVNHSGYDVFFDVFNGNGDFEIDDGGVANTGEATISVGEVVDRSSYDSTITSTITFADDGNGGHTYTIDSPAVAATAYVPGSPITFNGIQVVIDGTPDAGDTFRVQASSRQSIFETLQDVVDTLGMDTSTANRNADFVTTMNKNLSELDLALDHLIEINTEVGARLNTIDSEAKFNEVIIEQNKIVRSRLEDLNFAEAVTEFNRLKVGLEAAHSSFAQIQGLSLFQLLR